MAEEMRILHVDDDENYRVLVAEQLERVTEHMTVISARSSEETLELLESETVDCILADYRIPYMSGIELLAALRERDDETPFILYTGRGSEEVASEAIAAGVSDYVTKSMTTDSWELLVQRIETTVDERRAREQARKSQRVADLVRSVQAKLVQATSVDAIDTAICETLVDADPYVFAWVGEYYDETAQVRPRESAGQEAGYLDAIQITTDEQPTGQGPTGRAIRTDSLVVIQDISTDPDYDPWRETAVERGYQSSAAIPLGYDGTLYGVLNLYADRTDAFGDEERELLEELGETIGEAYHRVQIQERYRVQYRELFSEAPDGMIVHDLDGNVLDVNEQIVESLGYTREELLSMSVSDFEVGLDDELSNSWDQLEPGETMKTDGKHARKDGSTFPVEVWVNKVLVDGEPRCLALSRDITERRERQQKLRDLKERLELAIEVANLGVWDWNVENDDIEYNDQLAEMFGYDSTTLDIDSMAERVHPDDRETVTAELTEHLDGETDYYDGEYRMQTADGNYKWVRNIGRAINRDEDGAAVRALGVYLDIDDRKQTELAVEQERDNLEILNQIVRHDIRNYLQIISLYADSLSDHVSDDGQDELARVRSSAQQAAEITQTAGDVAEVLLQTEISPKSVRYRPALEREVAEITASYGDVRIDIEDPIPAVEVLADDMLDSIFRNLLTNAIEHNNSETPQVVISVQRDQDNLTIQFIDNGPGVPDDRKEAIFEKGEKALGSSGTGLGLYLVQTLVTRYGGRIWVEDRPGTSQGETDVGVDSDGTTGSIFNLELPLAD